MVHHEFIRYNPGSRLAVLMVHGIAGSPVHFEALIPVIPEDFSIYNILLDGHGKTEKEFAATSMKKWKAQINDTLRLLFSRHEKVLIVAHSMGTLFALQAAMDYPDRIASAFLLNVPLRPHYPISSALATVRVALGNIRPRDQIALEMRDATSIDLSRNLLRYIGWAPRFWELLTECRRMRKLLPQLKIPALAFQARKDELVSFRSLRDLENHPCIKVTILEHSGHYAYRSSDLPLLQQALKELIEKEINK